MATYLQSFDKLKSEIELDPNEVCDGVKAKFNLESTDMTVADVKAEIEKHSTKRDELTENIPTTLAVSAFLLNIEEIRSTLLAKRSTIIDNLKMQVMDYANAVRDVMREKYDAILTELSTPLDTIYIIDKLKKYMEDVPTQLLELMKDQKELFAI